MKQKKRLIYNVFYAVLIAVIFAFLVRGIFGLNKLNELYSVMTVAFLLFLPFAIGYLTVFLCNLNAVSTKSAAFFIAIIPVFVFFILTLLFSIEGLACWIMILPIFIISSGIGGLTARHFKLTKKNKSRLGVYFVILLPFFLSPIEKIIGAIPGTYKAYTEIDINANKKDIWQNVTRVRAINVNKDSAMFTRKMGFPRPIKAELDKEAVGGKRKAIFDKGLVFEEVVIDYQPQKNMTFTIHADPYNIPSTTMDEHIVIGGEFFDVLNGTYELEQINTNTCKLRLYSTFKLNTTFNFYAGIWATWIMKDIQQNILKVIKERAEKESIASIHN